jgi:hypothetical protein
MRGGKRPPPGLAATRSLLVPGCKVAMLEARVRIGGRVWTEPWHNLAFDHGASFIHAKQINPWTRIAGRLGGAAGRGKQLQSGQKQSLVEPKRAADPLWAILPSPGRADDGGERHGQ